MNCAAANGPVNRPASLGILASLGTLVIFPEIIAQSRRRGFRVPPYLDLVSKPISNYQFAKKTNHGTQAKSKN